MADEEELDCCPLCMEELDLTDKTFNSCPCGYQVCLWCWHQIKNEYNALCPACRAPYTELSKQKVTLDREDVVRRTKQRKQKEKTERRSAAQAKPATVNRKNLANVRVMQRNLVYVIGLPVHFADEEILRSNECFGQYGKIIKAVVNKSHLHSERVNATASAYITFANKEDASVCINAIDGFYLDGALLRASFGTTKYCNFFLRNLQCNNPDCLYLHELGEVDDSFTKEEMQSALHASKAAFRDPNAFPPGETRSGSSFPAVVQRSAAAAAHSTSSSHTDDDAQSTPATASDAQRKAQSAAAVYKLKHSNNPSDAAAPAASTPAPMFADKKREDSFSKIVARRRSENSSPTLPDPPAAQDTREKEPAPMMNERKPDLRVDTSRPDTADAVVGPLEALKLATSSASQEPAWAQPFPSPSIANTDREDRSASVPLGVYSPFGLGFEGGIRRSTSDVTSNAEPERGDVWRNSDPIGMSFDANDASASSMGFPPLSAGLPAASTAPSASSSSFASIDAIFSQRSESSEALAGLLGVQLSATPLSHGSNVPPQPKSARSSRFAFANQSSGADSAVGASRMEAPPSFLDAPKPSFLGYGGFDGLGSSASSGGAFSLPPVPTDTSAFPPLGSHLPASSGAPLSGSGMLHGSSGAGSSGLAFLQQMLPNVNISYGGDYNSRNNGMANDSNGLFGSGNVPSQDTWGSSSGLNSLGFGSDPATNGQRDTPFYDPAIISHSTMPGSNYYPYGNKSSGEDADRQHALFGGMYRHPGSVTNEN